MCAVEKKNAGTTKMGSYRDLEGCPLNMSCDQYKGNDKMMGDHEKAVVF